MLKLGKREWGQFLMLLEIRVYLTWGISAGYKLSVCHTFVEFVDFLLCSTMVSPDLTPVLPSS